MTKLNISSELRREIQSIAMSKTKGSALALGVLAGADLVSLHRPSQWRDGSKTVAASENLAEMAMDLIAEDAYPPQGLGVLLVTRASSSRPTPVNLDSAALCAKALPRQQTVLVQCSGDAYKAWVVTTQGHATQIPVICG